jgi:Leucine-rich repeat (LRR) protein
MMMPFCRVPQTYFNRRNNVLAELNNLTGSVPTELGLLTTLLVLDLEHNSLAGRVPDQLCDLANLEVLTLGFNDLTGPLPACRWSNMFEMQLKNNTFTGTIPAEFCRMPKLLSLILDNNQLKGKMPTCTGDDWQSIELLGLSDNLLTVRNPSRIDIFVVVGKK